MTGGDASREARLSDLSSRRGRRFADPALLEKALTHSSWAHEHGAGSEPDNERLQFLGDALLGLIVAERQFLSLPARHEQVEPHRAPPLLPHRDGVARDAAGEPGHDCQLDRIDPKSVWSPRPIGNRSALLSWWRDDPRCTHGNPTPQASPIPWRVELHDPSTSQTPSLITNCLTGPNCEMALRFPIVEAAAQFLKTRWASKLRVPESSVRPAESPRRVRGPTLRGLPGVNVIGYTRSEHGVGQSARAFVSALDAAGIGSSIIDFNEGNLSRTEDRSLESRLVSKPAHRINVFHINADQMAIAEQHLPAHVFERFNIGYWAWELPDMLDEHLLGFQRVDEVWVPSAFVQDAVSKKSPVPVLRMPYAVHFSASADNGRRRFGLPGDRFLFLTMFDLSSIQERKNPVATLEAFDRAFNRGTTRAALVVKTQNAEFHPQELAALRELLSGRKHVIWINKTLPRQDVYDLIASCDAFVSLHRSEGFGLALAEAMLLGKPVVATNWSGNTDFMRPDNSFPVNFRLVQVERDFGVYRAGQTWADPDIEHAASLLRQVMDNEPLRAKISQQAMRTIREEFSPESVGRRIRARLDYLQRMLESR
jgi:glycosyltransferase involved in cell wall biosynthesis